uniref:Uncharacterized protein n=1 Tax=Anopheles funestus TaxID=62324 RepID=A0A4Y0BIZ2_ANOFN
MNCVWLRDLDVFLLVNWDMDWDLHLNRVWTINVDWNLLLDVHRDLLLDVHWDLLLNLNWVWDLHLDWHAFHDLHWVWYWDLLRDDLFHFLLGVVVTVVSVRLLVVIAVGFVRFLLGRSQLKQSALFLLRIVDCRRAGKGQGHREHNEHLQ